MNGLLQVHMVLIPSDHVLYQQGSLDESTYLMGVLHSAVGVVEDDQRRGVTFRANVAIESPDQKTAPPQ